MMFKQRKIQEGKIWINFGMKLKEKTNQKMQSLMSRRSQCRGKSVKASKDRMVSPDKMSCKMLSPSLTHSQCLAGSSPCHMSLVTHVKGINSPCFVQIIPAFPLFFTQHTIIGYIQHQFTHLFWKRPGQMPFSHVPHPTKCVFPSSELS